MGPSRRQRAGLAVVAVAPLLLAACTERVTLLTAELSDADQPDDSAPADAGRPPGSDVAAHDTGAGPRCSQFTQDVRLEFESPEVVIALDRSFSMFQHKGGDKSWWQAAKQELSTYIEANEGAIQFGYEEFPDHGSCDPSAGCCASPLIISPSLNSHWDIEKQWRCDGPANYCYETTVESPSGDSLSRIRDFYEANGDQVADRFVLLITDGDPSCATSTDECNNAQHQANKLFSISGVKTIVLGIGDDTKTSACLDAVADMGQTAGQGSPRFTWVGDQGQFQAQIQKAMAPAEDRACRYLIRDNVKNRDKLAVTASFMNLPRDPSHKEGWDLDPTGAPELQIYGSVCKKLKCNQIANRAVRAQVTCTQCGSNVDCP